MNVATVHTDHGRYVGVPNGNGTVTLRRRGPSGTAPTSRPDPIAALAEAWGRELASVTPDGVRIADYGVRNLRAEEESWCRAESKRARRAAKRAEDERRTAEGRSRELNTLIRRVGQGRFRALVLRGAM